MKDFMFIVLGILLYAIGYTAFILPERVVMGGVAGLSALIYYATNIPAGISIFVLNITLLVIAFSALTKQFVVRTIVGVLLLSLFIGSLQPLFQAFPIITAGEDKFMHVLIGGMLSGAGLGVVFSHNGSTGGTDILTVLLTKHFNLSFGRAMQFIDCTIIGSSYLLFHSMETIVYGIVFTLVASYVCDFVVNGSRQTVQFLIISKHYKEIADTINRRVNRGVTVIEGKGWYSKENVEMLVVLSRKYESQDIFAVIKQIDPQAVVSQTFCHGVFGEGFDKIK
ncbi:YitT family protein [Prevotella sp.]|uniref:YitT family protein n=1 Tax=Prevotella sp. TaxID=59823 RepID=UPI0025E12240|nr:YitT family protein [Prevotella sp.]MCI7370351.1 YitT family protein [Prevotella sp.]MDD6197806.1 YitT family protein [Prevotella sp.]MDY4645750.1 YitT family protein [Prevotella sp.]